MQITPFDGKTTQDLFDYTLDLIEQLRKLADDRKEVKIFMEAQKNVGE